MASWWRGFVADLRIICLVYTVLLFIVLKTNLEVRSTTAEITLAAGRERLGTFTNAEDSLLMHFPGLCPPEVSPS